MNLRKNKGEEAEVAAEAMNDIMFFLMLFFLIISTLVNPNVIKLAVPNNKEKKEMAKREPILLEVFRSGDILSYKIGRINAIRSDVESKLLQAVAGEQNPIIRIHADDDITIQDLADILSLGEKHKIALVFV